ncbi:MAG TPA: hypothetical protein VGC41_25445, partial [Kofleriaceae bacterium]
KVVRDSIAEAEKPEPTVEKIAVPESGLGEVAISAYQWRDALVAWTRATVRGSHGEPPLLAACTLHDICGRLGIGEARYMVWLLYGARLCGLNGMAPADLVEHCPGRWDDALGRSRVAQTGAFAWADDRVHLMPELKAALDETQPLFGTFYPSGTSVTRRSLVVGPEEPIEDVARWAALEVGALFAPNERGFAEPARFLLEARLRAHAPLVPSRWFETQAVPNIASVIVAPNEAAAKKFEIPITATWATGSAKPTP